MITILALFAGVLIGLFIGHVLGHLTYTVATWAADRFGFLAGLSVWVALFLFLAFTVGALLRLP